LISEEEEERGIESKRV